MRRTIAVAAMFALAASTMASAEDKDKNKHHPPPKGQHTAPIHAPVVGGPIHTGPIHTGPVHTGPVRVVVRTPWMFHGHPYAWHAVHYPRPWVYPAGYAYRLWVVGAILPPIFWSTPDYYYPDWAAMGLPPPDPGFAYVEYGPDLLLVNIATGEVVQVFPNAFS